MKRFYTLIGCCLAINVITLALVVLTMFRKVDVAIVANGSTTPPAEFVERLSKEFIASLETVNPANQDETKRLLGYCHGYAYEYLEELVVNRNEVYRSADTAAFVRLLKAKCEKSHDNRYVCVVECEKVLVLGGSERASSKWNVTYTMTWEANDSALLNPVGCVLVEILIDEQLKAKE